MPKRKLPRYSEFFSKKRVKQYGAALAGGTLGFIVDNVPGAITGAELGYKLAGRESSLPEKKEMVKGKYEKAKFSNESALTTRKALCVKKGKIPQSKKGKVRVSRALRQKIGKVIEQKKIHGRWTQVSYGYILRPTGTQFVGDISQVTPDFSNIWNFMPEDFLHIASVLFNGKVDSQLARGIDNVANLGFQNAGEAAPFYADNKGCYAKFHVVKSFVKYLLKNNTQNSLKVTVYTVGIKSMQSFSGTNAGASLLNTNGTFQTQQYQGAVSPSLVWQNSLATNTGHNVTNATADLQGMRPEMDPKWSRYFRHQKCEMIIEAGQSISFNVDGPSDLELDYQKFYHNGGFQTLQKFSRGMMFIVENDLVQGTGAGSTSVGRYRSATGGALLIEKTMSCKISVPESTGLKVEDVGAAGAKSLELNYRREVFGYRQYGQDVPAAIVRIDEEQPASATN